MTKVMPPLNPLRAFEAAGRHVSFTRAAEELGVTQTAVSRQVAVLEGYLRNRLFERHNSELVITDTGRAYLEAIRPALEMISEATAATRGRATNVLKVRLYLTFALRWLLPRLPRFRAEHPNIDINLTTSIVPVDFDRDDIDVNICHGDGRWSGIQSCQVFQDQVTPVGARSLIEGPDAPQSPAELIGQNLLHSRNRVGDWADWFQSVNVDGRGAPGLVLETSSLVYEAARQGLGFAIGQVPLLKRELDSGELVAPFPVMRRKSGYYMLHRTGRIEPKVRAFREWMLREVEAQAQEEQAATARGAAGLQTAAA
ncbi:transcriptional regulator GcvA [Sphingosinicella terrae]|uniref:transcriptional regulator GcvA n=1 Tax=Sphingosinicella terrae TaxID=2172047 RepID=UPI000E0D4944|nr:transcriptional regulator GcvA [Sphingosinicella terrae]